MSSESNRSWAWPSELRDAGILGINRRNLEFIAENNPRIYYPRVDNKLLTKRICEANQIPIPSTYAVLKSHGEVYKFPKYIEGLTDFVIKPASGAAGRGIIVVAARSGEDFKSPSGKIITWSELRYHLSTVISGLYSLGGKPDEVIVEQRIISHHALVKVTVGGTPDIRVILYQGVPVMAMVRLPTTESGGRANLHQGAIAAAVDLSSGVTFGGVCKNRKISWHPDTGEPIAGLLIPGWKNLLTAAMKLGDVLEMGYVGIDFVIDANDGPVVLEANARPGLAIQVAHGQGIIKRLEYVGKQDVDRRLENRWEIIEELAKMH